MREKQRCRETSADTNLRSSRHSTYVKERGGRGEVEEEEDGDERG